ncbi:MAG TPA: ATP-binding protein [Pseudolysinimonas sp.]|nr:ATP-binding protein [Pseudolysinimonas sp.]
MRVGATRTVVLIDGRSGAGKTSLARVIAPAIGAHLVSLDDLYPGWQGLQAASRMVHEQLLRREEPGWRRWDWGSGRQAEWHPVDPDAPIVIEGCGAISRASRALADVAIWVEAPDAVRRQRALDREPGFAAHWESWAEQERAHADRENPRALADVIVESRSP